MRALIAALLLAGCWTNSPAAVPSAPPATTPPQVTITPSHRRASPCAIAVDHVAAVLRVEIEKIPEFADKLGQLRDAAVASCDAQLWDDDVIQCFASVIETADLASCDSKLEPQQTNDLMKRFSDIENPTP